MTRRTVHADPDRSNAERIPAIPFAARSQAEEEGKHSTDTQVLIVTQAIRSEPGRFIYAGPFVDHASGSKANRGPGLEAAIQHSIEASAEYGQAELWAWHSSRFGRGTGRQGEARAIGKLYYDLRERSVALRTVEDDEFVTNEMLIGFASRQASKYAEDLAANVRRGLRDSAMRGEWKGGICLDGYKALREAGERGRVKVTLIKHPERRHIYELLWEMALDGRSLQAIQLEFSSRGFMTAPVRKDHKPRPFDVNRISQALDNAFYAGIVVHNGEVLPVRGQWPRYVEPEEFHRLREERRARCHATKRTVGRPVEGYLLADLARCGQCGGTAHAVTGRVSRTDGTRLRTYVCRAHRDHHRDSREHCPATPYDAVTVDRAVIAGIEDLITDADAVREQLFAGRAAEQERLAKIAEQAHEDAAAADRAADRAEERYADALAPEDDSTCEVLLGAAKRKREEAKRARTRLEAALDALSAAADESEGDQAAAVMERIWEALSGNVHEAQSDIQKLNAVLREWFDAFELHHHDDGSIGIVPFLSATAVARVMREPALWPRYGAEAWMGSYHAIVPRRKGEMPAEMLATTQQRFSWAEAQGVEPVIDVGNPPELTSTQNPQSPRSKHSRPATR